MIRLEPDFFWHQQTFLWLITCNRDALRWTTLQLCSNCIALAVGENGHLSTVTLSIKGQRWPPCHKMACSGFSLFDFPASLSPSRFILFIWKGSLVVLAVKYYKSSITLPLAHWTSIDEALEQVKLLLQRGHCCVLFLRMPKSMINFLGVNWTHEVSKISLSLVLWPQFL